MGSVVAVHRVKGIAGLIYADTRFADTALEKLTKRFGAIDFESAEIAFNYTDYYEHEFGAGLRRKFISFKKLILPDTLASIKVATNSIESALSSKGMRKVNIDPGYLDLAKLVLATTKDFAHRIYLSKGIYAETTLIFRNKTFTHWEWTYPDYRTPEYISIFNSIRQLYAKTCVS